MATVTEEVEMPCQKVSLMLMELRRLEHTTLFTVMWITQVGVSEV